MWRYVVGAGLARTADEGARVGLVLLAVERTGSPTLGGMLVAALLVPQVVAAPVVGRTVDRARRPARTLGVLAAGFAVCLGLAAAVLGRVSVVLVVLLLLAAGTMAPAVTGGLSSRVGGLVAPERLGRAFGVDSVVYNVCGVAGPAGVGVLAAGGAGLPMTALAAGGVVGSLVVARLPLAPSSAPDRAPGAGATTWAGLTVLVRDPALSAVTVASCLSQVGLGALGVVVALAAARGGSVQDAALVLAALPVGALVGSLAWTWRPVSPGRAPSVVMWSEVGLGVPVALAGAARGLGGLAALLLVSGVALGPATGALLLTREHRSPAELVAQVFGIGAGVKLACGAGGAALAGLVAGLDSWVLLLGCGALPVAAGVLGAVMLRSADRRESVST
jgi:hypothetical protein